MNPLTCFGNGHGIKLDLRCKGSIYVPLVASVPGEWNLRMDKERDHPGGCFGILIRSYRLARMKRGGRVSTPVGLCSNGWVTAGERLPGSALRPTPPRCPVRREKRHDPLSTSISEIQHSLGTRFTGTISPYLRRGSQWRRNRARSQPIWLWRCGTARGAAASAVPDQPRLLRVTGRRPP